MNLATNGLKLCHHYLISRLCPETCPVFHLPVCVLLLSARNESLLRFHYFTRGISLKSHWAVFRVHWCQWEFFHWLHWGLDQCLLTMQVREALGLCSEWFRWLVRLAFCIWRQIHCLLQLASGKACWNDPLCALHKVWPSECALCQGRQTPLKLSPLQHYRGGIQPSSCLQWA